MVLDRDIARNTIASILDEVRGVADKAYQLRVWIKAEGNEVDDFDETVNSFFVLCDPIMAHPELYVLSHEEYTSLKMLYEKFREFADSYDIDCEEMLNHPKWEEVISLAKEALKVFNGNGCS